MASPKRVVQWSTGQAGIEALRGILDHPGLELVGVWCHSSAKEGVDAGALCGRPTTGVTATTDVDHLLALAPDCVSYNATDTNRRQEAVDDVCRILRAGINVVSTTHMPMVYPPMVPDLRDQFEAACQAGGASLYVTGIDPGFMLDLVPGLMTSCVRRLEHVSAVEILDLDRYDDAVILAGIGFGQTSAAAADFDAGPFLEMAGLGATPRTLVAALGLPIEQMELRTFYESLPLTRDTTIKAGTYAAGTVGCLRMGYAGLFDGVERVRCSWAVRIDDELAPKWWPPQGAGDYAIEVRGEPCLQLNLVFNTPAVDALNDAYIVTAMRAVNAIPRVCAAPPGILTVLSIGHYSGTFART